jgi:hypothetical protein
MHALNTKFSRRRLLAVACAATFPVTFPSCVDQSRRPKFDESTWNGSSGAGRIALPVLPPGHNLHVHPDRKNWKGFLFATPAPLDKRIKAAPSSPQGNYQDSAGEGVRIYDWDGLPGGANTRVKSNGTKTTAFFADLDKLKKSLETRKPGEIVAAIAKAKQTHFGDYNQQIRTWIEGLNALENRINDLNKQIKAETDETQALPLQEELERITQQRQQAKAVIPESYFRNGRIADIDDLERDQFVCTQSGALFTDALNYLGIKTFPVNGRFVREGHDDKSIKHYFPFVPAWHAIIESTASGESAFAPISNIDWGETPVCTTPAGKYAIERVVIGDAESEFQDPAVNSIVVRMLLQKPEFWESHGIAWIDGTSYVMPIAELDKLAKDPAALGPVFWSLPASRGPSNFGAGEHFLPVPKKDLPFGFGNQ